VCASLEIAGRLRGGRGLVGWIAALPWDRPFMLAAAFSLVMLGLGGAGGLINMSYAFNSTVHNTQWVTGHFHLIYGGAIVIIYFAIAYELWPRLTGRPLAVPKMVRWQLWTWFIGMLVTTLPWHLVGLMGQPRRMAYFDYADPALAPQAIWVSVSAIGGFVLVLSAALFIVVLIASHRAARATAPPLTFSLAVHPPRSLPASLNGFGVWMMLVVALTVANYGYPIAQSLLFKGTGVAAYPVLGR
jgi:cytochrome c oxidase subunit 1